MKDQQLEHLKIQPEDLSKTFENVMHVFQQGNTERLPDLLQDAGNLLMKASRKLSTTQLVLAVAALAVGVIFVAKRVEAELEENDNSGN
ncbi:hypothetical protein [Adhaeribacter radiodurans]|uniref:Uncharacterized protein n=1 Tax=Adhaeribacter radiodurans TaxID=2745197 RepID=A0A7L7LEL4_9BACT|nr:hypothetical protein [Adhaeribacter radiodurans]QMU31296.1 hypothetical protein HUW48_26150 [Adhaeribacter radiodurans]